MNNLPCSVSRDLARYYDAQEALEKREEVINEDRLNQKISEGMTSQDDWFYDAMNSVDVRDSWEKVIRVHRDLTLAPAASLEEAAFINRRLVAAFNSFHAELEAQMKENMLDFDRQSGALGIVDYIDPEEFSHD